MIIFHYNPRAQWYIFPTFSWVL